jgi:hypothetical protein
MDTDVHRDFGKLKEQFIDGLQVIMIWDAPVHHDQHTRGDAPRSRKFYKPRQYEQLS